ncbi:hypothetical protein [Reyranella sp.]|uniref:hypothetical protein n=1 Tax=Reyranella sp. TaxID=1929291 RepID=UPI0037851527
MMKAMRSPWLIVPGMLMLAGCQGVPGADGRYATPGRGGWDSFRAEAPAPGGMENFRAEAPPPTDARREPGM